VTPVAALLLGALAAIDLAPAPPVHAPDAKRQEAATVTHCGACHGAEGWERVTFDHARTGFPLDGAHRSGACRGCHAESDFKRPVPRACVACHRDVHAGRLGTRCANCHDAVAWKEPSFGPEAHRRTDFPLDGRHAVIPCEECHGDRRDRGYSRVTRRCAECHQWDLARAAAGVLDHSAFGPSADCRACHGVWRFSPAYFAGHDACFPIRSGTHSGIRCSTCHTSSLSGALAAGTCGAATGTFDCNQCHTCASRAGQHAGVNTFSTRCTPPVACFACHPSGSAGGG
jgi:hypothetical protein